MYVQDGHAQCTTRHDAGARTFLRIRCPENCTKPLNEEMDTKGLWPVRGGSETGSVDKPDVE